MTSPTAVTTLSAARTLAAATAANMPVDGAGALVAAGGKVFGFTLYAGAAGARIATAVTGVAIGQAGAAITEGAPLQVGTAGALIPRTTGELCGYAYRAASTGDFFEVVLASGGSAADVATKVATADLGGAAGVAAIVADAHVARVHKIGLRGLLTSASTFMRAMDHYGATNSSYSRTAGVVQVDCASFPDCDVDRYIYVCSQGRGDIDAIVRVTSATDIGGGKTRIVGTELYTSQYPGGVRPNIAAGSVTSGTMFVCDKQSASNLHAWVTMLVGRCNGALEIVNCSVGGSNPDDWIDPDRQAYVAGLGPFDFAIADFGEPNSMTQPTMSSETINAKADSALAWLSTFCRRVIKVTASAARIGGDAGLVAAPELMADFTTASRITAFEKLTVMGRNTNVEIVDTASASYALSTIGSADNSDLLHGRPPLEMVQKDGIHQTPMAGILQSENLAPSLQRDVLGFSPWQLSHVDHVFANTAADFGGKYNPNGLYDWNGAVATTPVLVSGLIAVGTGVEGTTVTATGIDAGTMSGTCAVQDAKGGGGREMVLIINDPSVGGLSVDVKYRGPTAFTLLAALNDARFRGVDLSLWWDFGIFGFNLNSVYRWDAGLYATSAAGGTKLVAGFMSDRGAASMFGAQRGWTKGFRAPMRAGNGKFRLAPASTVYTDAYLRLQFEGVAGSPIGRLKMLMGKKRLLVHQDLTS